MEKDQEKKHVCKLCNKSFLSGKILGGHMRVHLAANSRKEDVRIESNNMGFEGYELRENPKKSWRLSGLKHKHSRQIEELVKCYVCGKEFESPRSLHGHMRHHSKLERKGVHCQECGKAFRTLRALTGHMRLHSKKLSVSSELEPCSKPNLAFMSLADSETMNLVRRKRSNRIRYKVTPNSSFSSLSESVPDFEIDQEVEEVALCLIMMSRGVHDWGEFSFVCDYLDDRCICQNKRIRSDDRDDLVDGNQFVKEKAIEELYTCVSDPQKKPFEYSECDCEMVSFEEMKVGMEVQTRNVFLDADSYRPKLGDEAEPVLWNAETNQGRDDDMNGNLNEAEPNQDLVEVGLNFTDLTSAGSFPSNDAMIDCNDAERGKPSCSSKLMHTAADLGIADDVSKTEIKCRICSKILPTYQALGGHQSSHRLSQNVSFAADKCQDDAKTENLTDIQATSKLEDSENAVDMEMEGIRVKVGEESKKSKEYRCHICFKTFVSGQALGGHKRAHVSKTREEQTVAITQEGSDICAVFATTKLTDMVDVETNSGAGFNSWWSQKSCHLESLASLVAN